MADDHVPATGRPGVFPFQTAATPKVPTSSSMSASCAGHDRISRLGKTLRRIPAGGVFVAVVVIERVQSWRLEVEDWRLGLGGGMSQGSPISNL